MKKITKIEYLKGIAIMALAEKYYKKFREFEKILIESYGEDISDEIYGTETFNFDQYLKDKSITVIKDENR